MKKKTTAKKDKSKQFIKEMVEVCRKYEVQIRESELYDSDENYSGSVFYFQGPEVPRVELADIQEVRGD